MTISGEMPTSGILPVADPATKSATVTGWWSAVIPITLFISSTENLLFSS
jgi:hypothetical protein